MKVLEELDNDIGYNYNVQENIKDGPEVNVKLTVHSNKLSSCFEKSDSKVHIVAEKGNHVKSVADIINILFKSFNRKLNEFIVELK